MNDTVYGTSTFEFSQGFLVFLWYFALSFCGILLFCGIALYLFVLINNGVKTVKKGRVARLDIFLDRGRFSVLLRFSVGGSRKHPLFFMLGHLQYPLFY